jgi:type II secretory pathway component GspD/PulD (secretin)
VSFNYADPGELLETVKDRYPNVKATTGRASGGQGAGGVLIVTGTQADVDSVRGLVAENEEALSRGIAAAKTQVYYIKYAEADDLTSILARLVPGLIVTPGPSQGFSLKAPTTADPGGATSTTASYGATPSGAAAPSATASGGSATKPTTYSLLLTGTAQDIARAMDILEQVDVKPLQINYEARITEIKLNSTKDIGLNWDFSGATTRIGEFPDSTNTSVDTKGPTLGDNGYPGKILKFGAIGRTAISDLVNVQLDALFKTGNAKLLSDPNISAVDGQQAAVFIGDAVRYISSITQTATGPTVTTDTVNVGIKLFVTGKASHDGYVTLNIHPEVSTITGFLAVPGGGSLPQVSNREATTTVRVKDGETLAIGGLISENDIKNVQKVPILGDLPFFGALFRDTQHQRDRTEVVVFVKVSIAKDAA